MSDFIKRRAAEWRGVEISDEYVGLASRRMACGQQATPSGQLDNEDEDDGTSAIWAAFEREGGGRPLEVSEVNVDSLKERLKRGARRRAGQADDEPR